MTPDREALIHAIELRESIAKRDHHGFVDFTYEMAGDVLALLKGQPEIVRCKDCKNRGDVCKCPKCEDAYFYIKDTTTDDFFCADGVSKDE